MRHDLKENRVDILRNDEKILNRSSAFKASGKVSSHLILVKQGLVKVVFVRSLRLFRPGDDSHANDFDEP
jgi:hypothetical protein